MGMTEGLKRIAGERFRTVLNSVGEEILKRGHVGKRLMLRGYCGQGAASLET